MARAAIVGMESIQGSGWTVFDAFDIMVHLFTAENRAKYRLELLWKDAVEIPVAGLLARRSQRPVSEPSKPKTRYGYPIGKIRSV